LNQIRRNSQNHSQLQNREAFHMQQVNIPLVIDENYKQVLSAFSKQNSSHSSSRNFGATANISALTQLHKLQKNEPTAINAQTTSKSLQTPNYKKKGQPSNAQHPE
jgi:hypothetical protein